MELLLASRLAAAGNPPAVISNDSEADFRFDRKNGLPDIMQLFVPYGTKFGHLIITSQGPRGISSSCRNPVLHSTPTLYIHGLVNSPKRQRVVVGMSGGVDSSATAALLLEQGYEVIGITLKLWPQDCVNRAEDKCCGPQAVTDARAVCHQLNIPYYLID